MNFIDSVLDRFTMYKIVLFELTILTIVAFVFSLLGIIRFNPLDIFISLGVIVGVCFASNLLFSKIFKVPANFESYMITALILFFILTPTISRESVVTLVFASVIAMGSKYLVAINKRHIFNPAAFALVVIGVLGSPQAEWWISSAPFFPFILILGFITLRKIRRFSLFLTFFAFSICSILFFSIINKTGGVSLIPQVLTSWPIIFLGTVMLIEPMTTPPTRKLQVIYGAIVGILSGAQFHFGPIYSTAELSLIIGNIFSYAVSFKRRLVLTLKEKIQLAPTVYEFIFENKSRHFNFAPGQYMDWTLPITIPDMRGNRRYFTIASSPTEKEIKLGVKIDPIRSSSFKKVLMALPVGSQIFAGQLVGEFTLPEDKNLPLIFIAGGIGITPFRSMVKYLLDRNEKRDITIIYSNKDSLDIVFKDIFDLAENKLGIKTIYTLTNQKNLPKNWSGKVGRVSIDMIKEIPDYTHASYYLSGPHALVEGFNQTLKGVGISRSQVKQDFFPGFV